MKTITITHNELETAAKRGSKAFLQVFIDKYLQAIDGNLNAETLTLLNGHQNTLLAFHYLREEVNVGGFVQLIQNGYGGYIFQNPLAKTMKLYGAHKLSKLIYNAHEIYSRRREELEKEREEEELTDIYVEFEEFDELDEEFFRIEDNETKFIAHYVDEHIGDFAEII